MRVLTTLEHVFLIISHSPSARARSSKKRVLTYILIFLSVTFIGCLLALHDQYYTTHGVLLLEATRKYHASIKGKVIY